MGKYLNIILVLSSTIKTSTVNVLIINKGVTYQDKIKLNKRRALQNKF